MNKCVFVAEPERSQRFQYQDGTRRGVDVQYAKADVIPMVYQV